MIYRHVTTFASAYQTFSWSFVMKKLAEKCTVLSQELSCFVSRRWNCWISIIWNLLWEFILTPHRNYDRTMICEERAPSSSSLFSENSPLWMDDAWMGWAFWRPSVTTCWEKKIISADSRASRIIIAERKMKTQAASLSMKSSKCLRTMPASTLIIWVRDNESLCDWKWAGESPPASCLFVSNGEFKFHMLTQPRKLVETGYSKLFVITMPWTAHGNILCCLTTCQKCFVSIFIVKLDIESFSALWNLFTRHSSDGFVISSNVKDSRACFFPSPIQFSFAQECIRKSNELNWAHKQAHFMNCSLFVAHLFCHDKTSLVD